MDGWIKKMYYVPTMVYSASKKKETLLHVTMWMNLEGIM